MVGLGSIGREVVRRALAFEMRIIAYDPDVSAQTAGDLNAELVSLERLLGESDYVSLHVALTPETKQMINAATLEKMKTGVRIINCARGELIDPAALKQALESGKVAGAALDVFDPEPPPADFPLFQAPNLIATPHIAGSTEEAQEIVGIRIGEQLLQYLRDGVAINAVNMPALTPEQYRTVGPYVALAERLGAFVAQVSTGHPKAIRLMYSGRIADVNTHLIRNAALAGALNCWLSQRANIVNAMGLASERGLEVGERHEKRTSHTDSIRVELESDTGVNAVEGGLILDKPRLVQVDGIYCEVPLAGHLTFMKNLDVPGVIGHVGTVMGRNGINIANFSLGRQEGSAGQPATAVAVVETDGTVPEAVLTELKQNPAVQVARTVEFS